MRFRVRPAACFSLSLLGVTALSQAVKTEAFNRGRVVSHRVLVKLKPQATAPDRSRIQQAAEAARFFRLGGAGWWLLDSNSKDVTDLLGLLRPDSAVADVEPDFVGTIASPRPAHPRDAVS